VGRDKINLGEKVMRGTRHICSDERGLPHPIFDNPRILPLALGIERRSCPSRTSKIGPTPWLWVYGGVNDKIVVARFMRVCC